MESTELLEKLEYLNRKALEGNGPGRIKKQPDSGKLTARERLDNLLDAGTFVKMENNISSNISGTVTSIRAGEGSQVTTGDVIMVIE